LLETVACVSICAFHAPGRHTPRRYMSGAVHPITLEIAIASFDSADRN